MNKEVWKGVYHNIKHDDMMISLFVFVYIFWFIWWCTCLMCLMKKISETMFTLEKSGEGKSNFYPHPNSPFSNYKATSYSWSFRFTCASGSPPSCMCPQKSTSLLQRHPPRLGNTIKAWEGLCCPNCLSQEGSQGVQVQVNVCWTRLLWPNMFGKCWIKQSDFLLHESFTGTP